MSGYIEVGYVIVLGSLGSYAASLVTRERTARRRLAPPPDGSMTDAPPEPGPSGREVP